MRERVKRIRAARVMLEGWRGGRKAWGRWRLGQSTTTDSKWVAKQDHNVNRMRAISFFPYTHTFGRTI